MRRHFAIPFALSLLIACSSSDNPLSDDPQVGSDDGGSHGQCIPGQQIECACPGGATGAQACRDDGAGYQPCDCSAPGPADGGSDASNDGGHDDGGTPVGDGGNESDGGGDGGDGGDLPTDAGDEGGTICNETSQRVQRTPLAMYVMLDRSGSMAWNIKGSAVTGGGSNPDSRWYQVTKALEEFITSPQSAGISVGLQYFPGSPECNASTYENPSVPMGLLPAHAASIESSLNATSPSGGTPTRPALEGAIQYAKTWADANPTHTAVVVLATDGEPSGCSNNTISTIKAAAETGVNQGIKTFVIGISNQTGNLDEIAAAGGTDQAVSVTGTNVTQDFLDALTAIRGASLPCEYEIPAPPTPGDELDYENIRLHFRESGGATSDFHDVGNKANCGAGGFHYDNPASPTKIVLCPETCQLFRSDDEGAVDILVACK